MSEGEFEKRTKELVYVECNICHMEFLDTFDLKKFQKHWNDEHAVTYGYHSYPTIKEGMLNKKDILKIFWEAKKEFPLQKFEYQEPRKWNFVQYKHHYETLAHQVLELIAWWQKWFESVEKKASADTIIDDKTRRQL